MTDVTDLAANRRPPLTLGDLIMVPIRRWVPVVGLALVGLLLAALYLFLAPPSYTATSVVVLRPVVENPFTYPSSGADRTVNMNVENGIATGNEVVSAVSSATGVSAKAARDSLNVEVPVARRSCASSTPTATRAARSPARTPPPPATSPCARVW